LAGVVVMVVNLALPHAVLRLRSRLHATSEWSLKKSQAWTSAHAFHLHRAVLEGQSIGPWVPTGDDIPVLEDRGRLFSHVEEVVEAEHSYEHCSSEAKLMK
jgi:hypothetical protein